MPDLAPTLTQQTAPDGGLCAVLGGSWSAARLAEPASWRRINLRVSEAAKSKAMAWDLRPLTRLDHTGAQLLWNSWGHQWPTQLHCHPGQRAMLARVAHFTTPARAPARRSFWQHFLHLGEQLWKLWDHLMGLLALLGQLLLDTMRLLRSPARGPWRDVSGHLFRIGARALPVTALVDQFYGDVQLMGGKRWDTSSLIKRLK